MRIHFLFTILIVLCCQFIFATVVASRLPCSDTTRIDSTIQKDVIDLLHHVFNKKKLIDTLKTQKKINISFIPAIGYTLSTGYVIGLSSLTSFFTADSHRQNESVINLQAFYNSRRQQFFLAQSNIFMNKDQVKFATDLRINRYPDVTYGLGNRTTSSAADSIIYNYIRFYQTVLKKVTPNLYVGAGYCLDYHYNIVDDGTTKNPTSIFNRYGLTTSSRSSGFNLNVLFDTRSSPINSLKGTYANFFYRSNHISLGSDSKWSSIQLDLRKYVKLSDHSKNILAIWSYTWLSIAGKQPYLDLPSVGNDTYNNTGRGYETGRFRGKNMLYLEGEYRFGITKNGLLGAVGFASLQSYPRGVTSKIRNFMPAGGFGLRIKVNKKTNTNLAIDYAIGVDGSRGLFVNLGEIF